MELRFFDPGDVPEHTTAGWYDQRERAHHLEEPVHRPRLEQSAVFARKAIRDLGICTVSDMGAGDGGLLTLLFGENIRGWGYDLMPANVEGAHERGVDVRLIDALDYDNLEWGELTICTEFLEHLVDPHGFLREVAKRSRAVVASSPWDESAFPGQHYPFHLWAWNVPGYNWLLRHAGITVVETAIVGGFQVLWGRTDLAG